MSANSPSAEARGVFEPVHEAMRIAGQRIDTDARIDVHYPYDGSVIGSVPRGRAEHVRQAFAAAAAYEPKLTRYERQQILRRAGEALAEAREDIATLITMESGLALADSRYEVGRAYDVFTLAAQLCIQDDGEIFSCDLTPQGKARKIFTLRQPLRAIGAITPFNHPLNMVAHKIAPAIATNNCLVCKPTELTPLTAIKLADVLYESGLPPAMFSVVTGLPSDLGDAMITDPAAELVTFTGSVAVGKYVAERAGYRRTVLELGGNDPLIVMEDADLDAAAALAVTGATKNSGQRCTAVKRILVVEAVADELAALVAGKAAKLVCGDPMAPDTDIGTVITPQAADLFRARVKDAVANGANVLHETPGAGALFPPVVIDEVPYDCELVREETFGPAIPIIRCGGIDDLIAVSNSTAFGLSSGVCTNRLDYITRFVEELEVGTVNIWEVPGYRIEMSPFGGIKDSGLGYKEGVIEAMRSYTNVKTYSLPWPA